jgi:tRNA-dihydrouridine synthase B
VTVKLRSGLQPGGREGFELAQRLVADAGVAAIGFHPRSAATQHKGIPDYPLSRELAERIAVPVIISGGLDTAADGRYAYEASGAAAVMIARGSLGNPWIFEELTGRRVVPPTKEEMVAELLWVVDRAEEHLGPPRASRYLRKFYPWYLERLGAETSLAAALQETDELELARALIGELSLAEAAA